MAKTKLIKSKEAESRIMSLISIDDMNFVAKMLRDYIKKNNLSIQIGDKQYPLVTAWQWTGAQFGLSAICEKPVRLNESANMHVIYAKRTVSRGTKSWDEEFVAYASTIPPTDKDREAITKRTKGISKEITREYFSYECTARIERITDGKLVSTGFSTCSNLEVKKVSFEEYAVFSMAQTRAIGKGYRNLLSFVMNEAGVESTPAEEMEGVEVAHDTPKGKQQQEPGKPVITPDQLKGALLRISKGETDLIDKITAAYSISQEQLDAMKSVIPKSKKEANTSPTNEVKNPGLFTQGDKPAPNTDKPKGQKNGNKKQP